MGTECSMFLLTVVRTLFKTTLVSFQTLSGNEQDQYLWEHGKGKWQVAGAKDIYRGPVDITSSNNPVG